MSIYEKYLQVIKDFERKDGTVYLTPWDENDLSLEERLEEMFQKEKVQFFQVTTTEGFDSSGYTCWLCSTSWVDDKGLHLEVELLESM